MRHIYFLCHRNRCRSQMAEAFARKYAFMGIEVESAGLHPSPLHPYTIAVMKELGIDISHQRSKEINLKTFTTTNCVIYLGSKDGERGTVPSVARAFSIYSEHWDVSNPFPDDMATANIEAFRFVRDQIEREVVHLLSRFHILESNKVSYGKTSI